ncbi:zinc finger MYM-type protein 4-like [Gymnodraco acuticeps]|uniref:Zinc finger MYM-type protein 4-like n=1 Tax=Gymnodraco acuticeps TaxID=8218 RepID=A0A6P8W6Z0_GYMAC|nr:zinc finger MYM-type protein 4-like [Gymnodraco acuticeps]
MVDFGTVSKPELNSLLRQFYGSVRNTKGQQYAISTYVSLRAGINRFVNDPPYSRAWCLMKDNEFTTSNNVFSGLIKSLRRAGQDKTEHHPAITNEDLEILRKSRAMDPNTPRGLLNKVWFDIQLHFGRRGKEGLRKLTPQSFVVKRDSAGTKYVTMAFNEETKNHKCHNDRERQNRRGAMFEEPGNALCPVASFEAYLSTLPESAKAFYHHPRKSVKPGDAVWYSMEPLGVNSLGSMMTRISEEAGTTRYTNHCVRSTCIQRLAEAGLEYGVRFGSIF